MQSTLLKQLFNKDDEDEDTDLLDDDLLDDDELYTFDESVWDEDNDFGINQVNCLNL